MTRINSNISSLTARFNLQRANEDLETRLQRLSTGLRINRGADDPAGLIVSERLRSELEGIKQGVRNSERASNVIATTEGSLAEVNNMLNSIRSLVVEAANTGAFTPDEIEANQLQIDSAIESITRVANTASFGGLKLLNGQLGYGLSGVTESDIAIAKVNSALFADRDDIQVDVETVGSAQRGQLYLHTAYNTDPQGFHGALPAGQTDGVLPAQTTVEIAGPKGVIELTFASGTTNANIIQAINDRSGITGVQAKPVSAADVSSGIVFETTEYGKDSFVSVDVLSSNFDSWTSAKLQNDLPEPIDWTAGATYTTAEKDIGKDVEVIINGAIATGNGLNVKQRTPELDLELELTEAFATTLSGTPSTFHITGGGALFQLGPQVNQNQQASVGVESIAATRIGGTTLLNNAGNLEVQFLSSLKSGGANDLRGNLQNASRILETAIDEVSSLRGRLGAFERNVLDTNIRSLESSIENITASESVIRDADFAAETAELTRTQILSQSSTQTLSIANQQAQQVLQLLG